ncbi:MAG TPA: hypothetical protein VF502_00880 [Stellaceae bacterium]
MKKAFLLLIAATVAGCTSPPRNAQEMREAVRGGAAFTKIDKYAVARPFSAVFEDIKANADRCLNKQVRHTFMDSGAVHSETLNWHSYTKRTGQNTAETTVQLDNDAIAATKMPEGGWIKMLADIEGTATNKTDVTVYRVSIPSNFADVSQAIPAWAEGKKVPCPQLP